MPDAGKPSSEWKTPEHNEVVGGGIDEKGEFLLIYDANQKFSRHYRPDREEPPKLEFDPSSHTGECEMWPRQFKN